MFKPKWYNFVMSRMVETAAISTSGIQAAKEAMEALKSCKHVVLLGGGISLTEEIELKRAAAERELLLLGPVCGTSILNGEGFGIWNSVRHGPIGIIGTFGSGIQQVVCLVEKVGVSHALDVGSRDLSERVNAAGTISALKFLEADQATKIIVLLSRVPATSVARRVLEAARDAGKPTVVCLLGNGTPIAKSGLVSANTLEDAAAQASSLVKMGKTGAITSTVIPEKIKRLAKTEYERFGYGQRYIRGLFSGGALCTEAMTIIKGFFATIHSNIPLEPRLRLPDPHSSRGHACVDFGAEELAKGRHPAAVLGPRCARLLKEAKDWETAVFLFDVLLGNGANPDPANELARAVKEAKRIVNQGGGHLSVVASIVGTNRDPQKLKKQREQLESVGVLVARSNAQAARIATLIALRGRALKKLS